MQMPLGASITKGDQIKVLYLQQGILPETLFHMLHALLCENNSSNLNRLAKQLS